MSPRLLIAAIAALVMVAAVPGASASSHPAVRTPVASASAPAAGKTSITLRIVGCRACPVRLVQAHSSAASAVWHTRTKRVHNGHVTFTVPARRTVGMTFELNPRWSKAGWVTNVVTRYAHRKVGSNVTPARAARTHRAEACWAGTDQSRVRMVVRVVKFRVRGYDGSPGYAPRAWFVKTRTSVGPRNRTFRGALGNQDAYYCNS
ncbi:MAG: hypothetical protein WBV37_01815 [Nocardioidaceae bacterium]